VHLVGRIGRVQPKIADAYHARKDVWLADMDADLLRTLSRATKPAFRSLPKFPPVRRDVTVICPATLQAEQVEAAIREMKPKNLESLALVAVYAPQDNTSSESSESKGERNLTFRLTYRTRTARWWTRKWTRSTARCSPACRRSCLCASSAFQRNDSPRHGAKKGESVRAPLSCATKLLLEGCDLNIILYILLIHWRERMEYQNVCHDFIERTELNLLAIEGSEGRGSGFEVTQLINSLLGLIVLPKEFNLFKETDMLNELKREGWVLPRKLRGRNNPDNLQVLIRHLRNAIAHWGLTFISDGSRQISMITFCNMSTFGKNKGAIMWEGYFSVDDLRSFVSNLVILGKKRAAE
jgi:Phenylalanyl-tRNA synthetase beta subunit